MVHCGLAGEWIGVAVTFQVWIQKIVLKNFIGPKLRSDVLSEQEH